MNTPLFSRRDFSRDSMSRDWNFSSVVVEIRNQFNCSSMETIQSFEVSTRATIPDSRGILEMWLYVGHKKEFAGRNICEEF